MIIDFITTATLRPRLLERTYLSFAKNLLGVDLGNCRLFINIDPVGDGDAQEVIAVASQFFGEVVASTPPSASFPAAVKRLFLQPETAWAFNLEEDWLLEDEVHIDFLLSHRARVIHCNAHNFLTSKRCFLSPALWDTTLMADVAEQMNDWENPEVQIWKLTDMLRCGHYCAHPRVKDIGREWLEQSEWTKDTPKPERGVHSWTHWIRKTS